VKLCFLTLSVLLLASPLWAQVGPHERVVTSLVNRLTPKIRTLTRPVFIYHYVPKEGFFQTLGLKNNTNSVTFEFPNLNIQFVIKSV
jgi:hypothetical protein